jgi:N-acetylglutamate synthase-like GNAT family acetyltransferase
MSGAENASMSPSVIAAASHAIRHARASDVAALVRLLARAARPPRPVDELLAHGHLLVLDTTDGELGAAAHVELDGHTAHLDLLVVDPALHGHRLERRLLGVAGAFGEAHGCPDLDVTTPDL